MSGRVSELEALRLTTRLQAQTARKQLSQERRRLSRATTGCQAQTERRNQIGLCIVAMARDESTALKAFVSQVCSNMDSEEVDQKTNAIIQDFLNLSEDGIATLIEPKTAASKKVVADAMRFLLKFELFSWTFDQNMQKGVAPTIEATMQHQRILRNNISQRLIRVDAHADSSKSAQYKWVKRWRTQWGMPKGRFRPKDMPSVDLMRGKVRGLKKVCVYIYIYSLWHLSESKNQHVFVLDLEKVEGRKWDQNGSQYKDM